MKTIEAAARFAAERSLAYAVVPGRGGDDLGIYLPGATDRSEYEFSLVEVAAGGLVAAVDQALRRVGPGQRLALGLGSEPLGRSCLRRLDAAEAELRLAAEFLADLPPGAVLEIGCGKGRGPRAAIDAVKRLEKLLLAVGQAEACPPDDGRDDPSWPAQIEAARGEIASAVLPAQESAV